MIKIIANSPAETLLLGQELAKRLRGGDILAVSGELGAGKTVLIKGIAAGLGVRQNVRSPSFNLMKIYQLRTPNSELRTLVHLDCYRLKRAVEAVEIGLLDYLERKDTIVVIEWPERIIDLFKKRRLKKVKFKILKSDLRQISIF